MPEFNAQEWYAKKGEVVIKTTPRHFVDIWVSCSKTVQVLGMSAKEGTAAIVLKSGEEFRFKSNLKGFEKVIVRGTGNTLFGLKLRHSAMQLGEAISDEKPPVLVLPEPTNLVAKMRRMARDHHQTKRMPVLEPEDGPSFARYEIDDDVEEVLFEEEAYQKHLDEKKAKQEAAAAAQKAKAAEPPDPKPETGTPTPASDEAQEAPKAAPAPEPAQQATAAE